MFIHVLEPRVINKDVISGSPYCTVWGVDKVGGGTKLCNQKEDFKGSFRRMQRNSLKFQLKSLNLQRSSLERRRSSMELKVWYISGSSLLITDSIITCSLITDSILAWSLVPYLIYAIQLYLGLITLQYKQHTNHNSLY